MRVRHLVAVSSLALAGSIAGCGGSDGAGTPVGTGDAMVTTAVSPAPTGTLDPNAGAEASTPQKDTAADPKLIPALVTDNPDLQTLKTALGAADLVATLTQAGPYTVFAPGNDAFTKLGSRLDTLLQPASKDALANILKFHVVSGKIAAKDLKDGQLLTTLQGTRLRVTKKGNEITVGNSQGQGTIVSSDLQASNGVVHEIDTVLTPKPAK